MRSRGFQIFVVIFCGVILLLGLVLSFTVNDSSMHTMLIVFGVLYVIYLSLFLAKEKERRSKGGAKKQESPLLKR